MNREKRWQDQAERVNPNLWPSLSAKPKSPVIILFPVIFFLPRWRKPASVNTGEVLRATFPQILKTKSCISRTAALSQHVSSETSAGRSSKQNPQLRKGRERKSHGFK